MMSLEGFKQIDDTMLWKKSALYQIEEFEAMAKRLGVELKVPGFHTSKSIALPVVAIIVEEANTSFLLRDNFYDVNICVMSHHSITLSYTELFRGVYRSLDWDWYLGEIAKCRGYTWDYFTDEEMDNPQVLRVVKPHKCGKPGDKPMEWTVRRDEKERWLKRMTDPSWYYNDWSRGTLSYEGEFGPGVVMYAQQHPFAEGISGLVRREALELYAPGKTEFAFAVGSIKSAELIIRRVIEAIPAK